VGHGWKIKVATNRTLIYALSFYVKSTNIKNRNKRHAYVGPPDFIPSTCGEREISMWYEMLMKLKVVHQNRTMHLRIGLINRIVLSLGLVCQIGTRF